MKAQIGGRIITLSCLERGEVDRTGTGSSALTIFGERDVERSIAVNKRLPVLTHNSGRVTQICVFNTVKPGTSASSP